jgi:hypothetical protein
MRRIKDLETRAAELAAEIQALKTWPKEPASTFDGPPAVVIFTKAYGGGRPYDYAAIKAAGRWYVTGKATSGAPKSFSWEELLDFVDSATSTMMEAGSWVSLWRDHA